MKKWRAIFLVAMMAFIMTGCKDTAVDGELPTNQPQTIEPTNSETKDNETNDKKDSEANDKKDSETNDKKDNESNDKKDNETDSKTDNEKRPAMEQQDSNQQESNEQKASDTAFEATADELLDAFINGSISAFDSTDLTSTFYITDLNMDSEELGSYSVGEKMDLDNDGENELIINGPYGGIYLDARDNKVYEFAAGDGTALILSYTYYNGAVWIMYSNRSSAGFEFYHMEKFEGADNLVAEMNFGEEFDINNPEVGLKYTLNGTEISYDEYTEFCSKIFAAEVNTNF